MQIAYFPDIKHKNTLSEEESKHLVRVLRKSVGDTFNIVDGNGGLYLVEITNDNPKKCEFKIVSTKTDYLKRTKTLHIAIAPTKNIDRFEWFLEKSTEIGIDEITPILCDHSERKIIKEDRLEKILISAMKQSNQAYLPKLNTLTKFSEFIKNSTNKNQDLFIAHCADAEKQELKSQNKNEKTLILIGPEGDFSTKEVELAFDSGFKPISLGNNRLRTETAGIVAVSTWNNL